MTYSNKNDSMKLSCMASLLLCDCPNVDGNTSRLHAYLDKLLAICKVMLYERRKLLGLLPFNLNLGPPFPFVFHFLYPPLPEWWNISGVRTKGGGVWRRGGGDGGMGVPDMPNCKPFANMQNTCSGKNTELRITRLECKFSSVQEYTGPCEEHQLNSVLNKYWALEPVFGDLLKEARNRFPAWRAGTATLFVVPATRLHRLAESMHQNRFLGSINVYKYGLRAMKKF